MDQDARGNVVRKENVYIFAFPLATKLIACKTGASTLEVQETFPESNAGSRHTNAEDKDSASDSSVKSDSEKPDSTIDQSDDDYDLNECKDIFLTHLHSFTLISVLQKESLEVITRDGLLVPTFTKTRDSDGFHMDMTVVILLVSDILLLSCSSSTVLPQSVSCSLFVTWVSFINNLLKM